MGLKTCSYLKRKSVLWFNIFCNEILHHKHRSTFDHLNGRPLPFPFQVCIRAYGGRRVSNPIPKKVGTPDLRSAIGNVNDYLFGSMLPLVKTCDAVGAR